MMAALPSTAAAGSVLQQQPTVTYPEAAYAQLKSLLALLRPGDFELKKLHICRFTSAHELEERPVLARLQYEHEEFVSEELVACWQHLADVDALIANSRQQQHAFHSTRAGRRRAAASMLRSFRGGTGFRSPRKGGLLLRSGVAMGAATGEVDSSSSPSRQLLSRIRSQALPNGAASFAAACSDAAARRVQTGQADFRLIVARAARADRELVTIDLRGSHDFGALSGENKSQAILAFAHAAREGSLTSVHLDGLGLNLGVAQALAALLSAPKLRTCTLMGNQLNEAAVRLLAAALRAHSSLEELAIGDQNRCPLSTRAVHELLEAMETVRAQRAPPMGPLHPYHSHPRHCLTSPCQVPMAPPLHPIPKALPPSPTPHAPPRPTAHARFTLRPPDVVALRCALSGAHAMQAEARHHPRRGMPPSLRSARDGARRGRTPALGQRRRTASEARCEARDPYPHVPVGAVLPARPCPHGLARTSLSAQSCPHGPAHTVLPARPYRHGPARTALPLARSRSIPGVSTRPVIAGGGGARCAPHALRLRPCALTHRRGRTSG